MFCKERVRRDDLDQLHANMEQVIAAADIKSMRLEAFKCYYAATGGGLGLAGNCARPTPELLALQADIIATTAPFNRRNGLNDASTEGHGNPDIDTAIIRYVATLNTVLEGTSLPASARGMPRPRISTRC